jgi:cysteine desulfuration protein SufE
MAQGQLTESLEDIVELFTEVPRRDRIHLLLEFSESMPNLPAGVTRGAFEQVHECASPVFLQAKMKNGRVYYDIDVPREAPTVRGFANILREGLNGCTPEAIQAVPLDLYERLGLKRVLSPLRLRGLTALLIYMKRNAQRLAINAT